MSKQLIINTLKKDNTYSHESRQDYCFNQLQPILDQRVYFDDLTRIPQISTISALVEMGGGKTMVSSLFDLPAPKTVSQSMFQPLPSIKKSRIPEEYNEPSFHRLFEMFQCVHYLRDENHIRPRYVVPNVCILSEGMWSFRNQMIVEFDIPNGSYDEYSLNNLNKSSNNERFSQYFNGFKNVKYGDPIFYFGVKLEQEIDGVQWFYFRWDLEGIMFIKNCKSAGFCNFVDGIETRYTER